MIRKAIEYEILVDGKDDNLARRRGQKLASLPTAYRILSRILNFVTGQERCYFTSMVEARL